MQDPKAISKKPGSETIQVLKLKPLIGKKQKETTFILDLSSVEGSPEMETDMSSAQLSSSWHAPDVNPSMTRLDISEQKRTETSLMETGCHWTDRMLMAEVMGLGFDTERKKTDHYEFSLIEKVGDLFWCPHDMALVHSMSQDCWMGAGIAKEFWIWFCELRGL